MTSSTISKIYVKNNDIILFKNGQEFLKRSGIRQLPSILVNGIQLEQANIRKRIINGFFGS